MEQMKVEQSKGIKSDRGVTFNRVIRAGHIEKGKLVRGSLWQPELPGADTCWVSSRSSDQSHVLEQSELVGERQ